MNKTLDPEDLKAKGNAAFQHGDYVTAENLYSSAINADPSNHFYYLNRSMANLKLQRWSHAENDATKALELNHGDIKALYRRSVARREQGDFTNAMEDIRVFLELGGDSTTAKAELSRIPAFRIANAASKGLGAFALRPLHRGDLILAERPLFTVRNRDGRRDVDQGAVSSAVSRLSPENLQQYVALKNAHDGSEKLTNPLSGIFSTNSFSMDEGNSGIFVQASRFNHSCSPNARYSWNPEIKRFNIYALREIASGDEILVSYLSSRNVYGSPRAERQARLAKYAFTCACDACALQEPAAVASDRRRKEIAELWESVPHFPPNKTRQRLLAITRAIRLLQEEGYAADYDDFTIDAAVMCAFHSDWASAKYWATKTYETRVAEFGEDSYRAKEVKAMFLDPKSVRMAGMGVRQTFNVRL